VIPVGLVATKHHVEVLRRLLRGLLEAKHIAVGRWWPDAQGSSSIPSHKQLGLDCLHIEGHAAIVGTSRLVLVTSVGLPVGGVPSSSTVGAVKTLVRLGLGVEVE
jgi:hypothetical protein